MRICLEIIPAHHEIDDGFSRWMYSVSNALFVKDTRHEFLIILGPQGNASLLKPNSRCTIMQCPPRNQNINQQFTAARLARKWGADVLHNFGAPASLMWSGKMILTIHDAAIVTHPELFPKRWALFQKYAYAALKKKNPQVITVSEFSRQEIATTMGFPIDRIHVVHPIPAFSGRDVTEDDRARSRVAYPLPKKYFFYVGVIEPRKNLTRLIAAFVKYRQESGDADLVIGGNIGWKATEIVNAAHTSPFAAHIHFTGYISDELLPGVMAGAHAFVYPSIQEGFGIPPVEALMFDVPVLSSNASCLPEVLGNAALLVNPLDVNSIAAGLHTIDTDNNLRQRLITNGKTQRLLYSAEKTAARIECIYDLLAAES